MKPKKNPAAQAMARKRWDNMTLEERSDYGRKRANARWKKKKEGDNAK